MITMTAQALTVLVISEDRPAIRATTRFLQAFGYRVAEAGDTDQAFAALARQLPDFVLLDGDTTRLRLVEILDDVRQRGGDVYTFLMAESLEANQVTGALAAGVDDFLSKPAVFGQLLARLRAGARVLEHRRRVASRDQTDRVTELPSGAAFFQTLRAMLGCDDGQPPSVACVALNLDYYGRFARQHGQPLADQGLKAIAQSISDRIQAPQYLACDGDQFFVALPGATESDAEPWARQLLQALAEQPFRLSETTIQVTASVGVADNQAGELDQEELVQRALDAQKLAKQSGRNCVALHSQLHDEARSWASLASPGKLFETTVARDVMATCPVVVKRDQAIDEASTFFPHPGLTAVPVVDSVGSLVGYVTEKAICQAAPDQHHIRDLAIAEASCLDEDTSFARLIELFTHEPRSLVFIVHEGQPVGLVTRSSLTALSEPVDQATFRVDRAKGRFEQQLSVCDPTFCCET